MSNTKLSKTSLLKNLYNLRAQDNNNGNRIVPVCLIERLDSIYGTDRRDFINKIHKSELGIPINEAINWAEGLEENPIKSTIKTMVVRSDHNHINPHKFKTGDVLMHKVFRHPYILLKKYPDHWLCTLLTTEPTCTEILEPTKSRFFKNQFIVKSLFTAEVPMGSFMGIYDNPTHLRQIRRQLCEIIIK